MADSFEFTHELENPDDSTVKAYTVTVEVSGEWTKATRDEPADSPDATITKVTDDETGSKVPESAWKDIGLDDVEAESIIEKALNAYRDSDADPDADERYEESKVKALRNIDEMLAKLQEADWGKSLKFVADQFAMRSKDLDDLADKVIWQGDQMDGPTARQARDIQQSIDELVTRLRKELRGFSESEAEKVDEAKISMPQVIDQITRSLDELAQAEDPHSSVDALRDIISAVAGGLIKLGEKKSAAALSKIAMEIQPSEEPAVATSKESTSFTNI